MTYRDDHEAAVARLQVLERELEIERAARIKFEALARELEKAWNVERTLRERAEADLAQLRPPVNTAHTPIPPQWPPIDPDAFESRISAAPGLDDEDADPDPHTPIPTTPRGRR